MPNQNIDDNKFAEEEVWFVQPELELRLLLLLLLLPLLLPLQLLHLLPLFPLFRTELLCPTIPGVESDPLTKNILTKNNWFHILCIYIYVQ